jgi:ADP-heptose:LPS heptosyltransferase
VNRPDSRLGNLVLVMPLMAGLRERFPGARLVLLASDRFSELPASQGCEVISVAKARMASRPWLFPGFAGMLRREGFDCVLDASHPFAFSLSGAVVGGLAGARTRIGFASGDFEGWYTHPVSGLSRDEHESLTIHRLGSPWQGWPGYRPPRLIPRDPSGTGGIGLHVGASRGKFYPFEKMESLIVYLRLRERKK